MSSPAKLASFDDLAPVSEDILSEVLTGLSGASKSLPCKLFYDEQGSDLFQKICALPEYYPTRTEITLLKECAVEISALIGAHCRLVEYGTGSSEKMRIVLSALIQPAAFVAVDISREHLLQATESLVNDLPGLSVHAVCADFTKPFKLPAMTDENSGKAVVFFPGSSIGNFDHVQAVDFLANSARIVGPGGGLLIGVDLKKDEKILNAAYNDSAGVTAAFNKNLLSHINRVLDVSFDLDAFDHHAFYNNEEGRIEMHLISRRDQSVRIGGQTITFHEGEHIHTENSYKYDVVEFQALATKAGFEPVQVWMDSEQLFSVHYLETVA